MGHFVPPAARKWIILFVLLSAEQFGATMRDSPLKDKHMTIEKLAYSIPEAVTVSGRSRTALYQAFKTGELIARKQGARTIILADDLRHWLESLPTLNTRTAA